MPAMAKVVPAMAKAMPTVPAAVPPARVGVGDGPHEEQQDPEEQHKELAHRRLLPGGCVSRTRPGVSVVARENPSRGKQG